MGEIRPSGVAAALGATFVAMLAAADGDLADAARADMLRCSDAFLRNSQHLSADPPSHP